MHLRVQGDDKLRGKSLTFLPPYPKTLARKDCCPVYGIDQMTVTEDVALVTLHQVPAKLPLIAGIFETVGESGINIDMISQTTPQGGWVSLSFTVSGEELPKMMSLTARLKERHAEIRPLLSSGNVKLSLYGKEMVHMHGVAAAAIQTVSQVIEHIYLITTSELDISFLIPASDLPAASQALQKRFGL
jgi:aspartokinase